MPGQYHSILEKLIECDFAQGDYLTKSALQAALHRDVASPLKEVEGRIKS